MRPIRPLPDRRCRRARASIVLGLSLVGAGSVLGCAEERAAGPSAPAGADASLEAASPAIVVNSVAELVSALAPENGGARILVRAGTYAIDAPLTVPDGATLEGEGDMQFEDGLPAGFGAAAHTTLTMSANVPGNMLTLGSRATIRRLEIVDLGGRPGAVVAVVSREAGDQVSATIAESEIVSPDAHGIVPAGPTGVGLLVLTQNPNLGAASGCSPSTSRHWGACPSRWTATSWAAASSRMAG